MSFAPLCNYPDDGSHLLGFFFFLLFWSSHTLLHVQTSIYQGLNIAHNADYSSKRSNSHLILLLSELRFRDFAVKMACALHDQPSSALRAINLSSNPIEDKGTCVLLLSCPGSGSSLYLTHVKHCVPQC